MIVRDGCDWDDDDEVSLLSEADQLRRVRILQCQALAAASRRRAQAAEGAATAVIRAAASAMEQVQAAQRAAAAMEKAPSRPTSCRALVVALDRTARAGRIAVRAAASLGETSGSEGGQALARLAAGLNEHVHLTDFASLAVRVDEQVGDSLTLALRTAQAAESAASTARSLASAISEEAAGYDAELGSLLSRVTVAKVGDLDSEAALNAAKSGMTKNANQSSVAGGLVDIVAILALPPSHRERYREEWASEIGALADEGRGRVVQLRHALSLVTHALPLRRALKHSARGKSARQ